MKKFMSYAFSDVDVILEVLPLAEEMRLTGIQQGMDIYFTLCVSGNQKGTRENLYFSHFHKIDLSITGISMNNFMSYAFWSIDVLLEVLALAEEMRVIGIQ